MSRKKIAFLAGAKSNLSGGQIMIYNTLKNIDRDKFDVELIIPRDCELSDKLKIEDVTVHVVPLWGFENRRNRLDSTSILYPLKKIGRKVSNVFRSLLNTLIIKKVIKKGGYELVWCENMQALILVTLLVFDRTKIVYNMWSDVKSKVGLKVIAALSDYIIVEAQFQKQKFSSIKKRPPISVINTQISADLFQSKSLTAKESRDKLGIQTKEKVIGFLGGCRYTKGFDLFMEAAYIVVKKHGFENCTFLVGGINDSDDLLENERMKFIIEQLGSNIVKLKWISERDVFYQAIDVFVSLSRSEGLPGAVREAMGFSVPVIGTDVGGTSECIGDTGYIIDVNTNAGIVDQCVFFIETILKNESERHYKGIMAKNRAMDLFVGNSWIRDLEKVFTNVLCENLKLEHSKHHK